MPDDFLRLWRPYRGDVVAALAGQGGDIREVVFALVIVCGDR